jgi:uncharacterized protein YyaL (SSP411 family)
MKSRYALLVAAVAAGCAPVTPGVKSLAGRPQASAASPEEGPSGAPREALSWATLDAATFARAKAEHRLVVIDGSAEWCHWCHVMEATSYHDPEVRKILEAGFIAVKVDVDSRPDFEERYGAWGWPATVLLTPDGQELGKYKGYLAPDAFVEILRSASAAAKTQATGSAAAAEPEIHALAPAELAAARARIAKELGEYWDPRQGGWGQPQKAPLAWENAWALSQAQAGDSVQKDRVLFTLDRQSALVDPVWGGVSQYSTDGDWVHPHHEKLMAVQAGAIVDYAGAYVLTHEPRWLSQAQRVRGFVDHFLRAPDGGFLATMDADLNAHESAASGKPYVTGNAYYAMSDPGRRALGIPRVDEHEYGREAGLGIDAYLALYEASGDASALDAAKMAATRVLASHGDPAVGVTHGTPPDEEAKVRFLADNAAFGFALARLYATTHDETTLKAAQAIAAFLLRDLYDPHGGGFYASTPDPNAVGVFAARRKPFEHDVMAARFLERLGKVAPDARYGPAIATTLAYLARPEAYGSRGRFVGDLLLAIDESR